MILPFQHIDEMISMQICIATCDLSGPETSRRWCLYEASG